MNSTKQVDKSHYDYFRYQSPTRFTSYYYQIKASLELQPETIVEIGVGDGTFLTLARNYGIRAYGLDFDRELSPSVCASALQIPLKDESVDVVAAFQILEHLPYESLSLAAGEMRRVCRKGVVVSLPEFGNASVTLNLPFVRHIAIPVPHCFPFRPKHEFNGEHYWEINKSGFSLSRILTTFKESGLACQKTWINPYLSYHRFFIFEKN